MRLGGRQYPPARAQWLTDGTLKVLVQFTAGKPDLPNAPGATDLAKTKEGREAIQILSANSVLAWPLMAPPGLPADRVRELRPRSTP